MPCVRAVATRRARPALASQAEKVSKRRGAAEKAVDSSCRDHRPSAINSDNIIPSKHKRADRRWVRWNARPVSPNRNAEVKLKCTGVIRKSWI